MFRNGATNLICISGKYAKHNLSVTLRPVTVIDHQLQSVRFIAKHYDPKFKQARREKIFKPDFKKVSMPMGTLIRDDLKRLGKFPVSVRREAPITLFSSLTITDLYKPPTGDGKFSDVVTKAPTKAVDGMKTKGKTLNAMRKIKSSDPDFSKETFLELAKDVYIKAHQSLANESDDLIKYVTELAYPKMIANRSGKIIKWEFLESLEPHSIVQARFLPITSSAGFGQITVRFHTQQVLAIYDRFGRLMQGSDILRKDVLEYVVFEKNLALISSQWRVHAKRFSPVADTTSTIEKTSIKPNIVDHSSLQMKDTEKELYDALSQ